MSSAIEPERNGCIPAVYRQQTGIGPQSAAFDLYNFSQLYIVLRHSIEYNLYTFVYLIMEA